MVEKKKERPGVMIYFDSVRPALTRLDNSQCGELFRAIMDYAEYGVITDLDPLAGMVFDLLIPKIDRDAERYEETREQRAYAAYCREMKKGGEEPLKIAEWRAQKRNPSINGPLSPDIENNGPYSTSAISPTPTAQINKTTTASINKKENRGGEVEGYKGGGENWPRLQAKAEATFEEKRRNAIAKMDWLE